MAQVAMVMNLDKCIGCHTCSVTCKQVWTNRPGTEYVYFNNVETKPGVGYPRRYEDQEQWHGGWTLDRKGRLALKAGGRVKKLATLFWNPDLPSIDDYGDPWTYDYQTLIDAPAGTPNPSAHAISALTGKDMQISWGPNWDDNLAGAPDGAAGDPNLTAPGGTRGRPPGRRLRARDDREAIGPAVKLAYEQAFMFYLPRICEHCLNPSCVASCPSGAMYKRAEDGIVLVDQDRCRGWRMCVSGCPYKKVYFNHRSGKAEKCTFCFPRIESGQPTICSETCVGRLRYLGLMLYDADKVLAAAATPEPADLYQAQLDVFLDPGDPQVQAEAAAAGIPADWVDAARRSPAYALIARHKVALPLHPEYRTLPMVWYIPPLSPVADVAGAYGEDADAVFAAIEALRIPAEYLANLFTAGDAEQIRRVLRVLAAIRTVMRAGQLGLDVPGGLAEAAGSTEADLEDLYRLLAIAKYADRYVIPAAHAEDAGRLLAQHEQLFCAQPGGVEDFHPPAAPFRDSDGRLHLDVSASAGGAPSGSPRGMPDGEAKISDMRRSDGALGDGA